MDVPSFYASTRRLSRPALCWVAAVSLLGAVAGNIGCVDFFDTTRAVDDRLSVGGEIYAELCNRLAMADDPTDVMGLKIRATCRFGAPVPSGYGPRLQAFHAERQRFIDAVDHVLGDTVGAQVDTMLQGMTPLYDDGTVARSSRALAAWLGTLADNEEATQALARLGSRDGYQSSLYTSAQLRALSTYPDAKVALGALLGSFVPGGASHRSWQRLLIAVENQFANAEPTNDTTALKLLRDFLLAEDARIGDGIPRYIVARDKRGIAQPRTMSASAVGFVDGDGDGLADVDSLGRYVDATGGLLNALPPFATGGADGDRPRDGYARLLDDNGDLVYDYVNVSDTVFAAFFSLLGQVVQEDPALLVDLLPWFPSLLGPDLQQEEIFADGTALTYNGFDTTQSPILDWVYAGAAMVDEAPTYWGLRYGQELLVNREPQIARLISTASDVADWASEPLYEDVALEANNNLVDDLILLFTDILQVPGLAEDLLEIFTDPRVEPLGGFFAKHMQYADRIELDPADLNAPARFSFRNPVDRNRPDSGNNVSIFQRLAHLIHDTNGTRFCNKEGAQLTLGGISYPFEGDGYAACELFEIEDMAVFYVEAVLGTATLTFKPWEVDAISSLDVILESASGIDGFTKNPTPQAVSRMMFGERNDFLQAIVNPPRAGDGGFLEERHAGTIFAWEEPGVFEAFRPLFDVFATHGRKDFVPKLLALLHRHWSSSQNSLTQGDNPNAPLYSDQSGMVRLEGLVARALDEGDLFNVIGESLGPMLETEVDGIEGRDILVDLLRQLFLPQWNPNTTMRNGATYTTKQDGVTAVQRLAPIWLFRHAFDTTQEAFDSADETSVLERASRAVRKSILTTDVSTLNDARFFVHRDLVAALDHSLGFLAERLVAHTAAGDLTTWAQQLTGDAATLIEGPTVAGLAKVGADLAADSLVHQHIPPMLQYLLNGDGPNNTRNLLMVSVADMVQPFDDPNHLVMMKALAPALRMQDGVVDTSVVLGSGLIGGDEGQALTSLLQRLVTRPSAGSEEPLAALANILTTVNRAEPGNMGTLQPEDYAAMIRQVREFLLDDTGGLERLFLLLENR